MVNKAEIWALILIKLKSYADFLEKNMDQHVEAKKYVLAVRSSYDIAVKGAVDQTENDVQTMSASTAGLSRFYGEFYWRPNVDKIAEEYLHDLAKLSVDLLNAYGL